MEKKIQAWKLNIKTERERGREGQGTRARRTIEMKIK